MTPEQFVSKWRRTSTSERAASHEHFIDLCHLLEQPTPHEIDPDGAFYAFERGAARTGMASGGWADVWKRGHFGWEYKRRSGGRSTTLAKALMQLQLYALALESPPLLIVSDIDVIEIHTAFQNAVQEVHTIRIDELLDPEVRERLRWCFEAPERLRPQRTRDQATSIAAARFAGLAEHLREAGHDVQTVAHFLNRLLFCMYAEDAGLLRTELFTQLIQRALENPLDTGELLSRLFSVMSTGGTFGLERVLHFNGGLFDDDSVLPLSREAIVELADLARMDWSQIEPAIFGTLFERGLDPAKRAQLGAHYTDAASILRIVDAVITRPLEAQWKMLVPRIQKYIERMERVRTKKATEDNRAHARATYIGFLEVLRNFRVLDPACGSGNFLYLALRALKDLEHRVNLEAEALGLERQQPSVGPANVSGLEISSVAADLARMTVWIGEIQWMRSHGYSLDTNPVLRSLDTITCVDALIGAGGIPTLWPEADVIIGNPPFLGVRRMIRDLGERYTVELRRAYNDRAVSGTDLVTFWFERTREAFEGTRLLRAGLVSTNSIRDGANRVVIDRLMNQAVIETAWSDEPWVNEGAAVRVSIICVVRPEHANAITLNGVGVARIRSDLTEGGENSNDEVTDPKRVPEALANVGYATQGPVKSGRFEVEGTIARTWLNEPNTNGLSNARVLRPWLHGDDVTGRPDDKWIIDFHGIESEIEASLFEAPFEYVRTHVHAQRMNQRDANRKRFWWCHGRAGTDFRTQTQGLSRYIATQRVATHRIFVWADARAFPDSRILAIASQADSVFGVLQSRVHEAWTLATCSWHGKGNDPTYDKATCFMRFAFPDAAPIVLDDTNSVSEALTIAEIACELDERRRAWLQPPEWSERIGNGSDGSNAWRALNGYENMLRARTLTRLYNKPPRWLTLLHHELDKAVFTAYGWSDVPSNSQIVERLVALAYSRNSK